MQYSFHKITISLSVVAGLCLSLGCSATGTVDLPPPGGMANGQFDIGRGQSFDEDEEDGILVGFGPKDVYKNIKGILFFCYL